MRKAILPVLILAGAVAVTGMLVSIRQPPAQEDIAESVPRVEVFAPTRENAHIIVQSQGTVQPRTRTDIVSEVSGRVIEVAPEFVVGGFFSQGDVLMRLDDQDYTVAVTRAEATAASARSQLAQARSEAEVARREWESMTPAQQDQIRARELYLRLPQLEEARASLLSAEAALEQARSDLAKTTITAPYDGLISARSTDIGQYVSAGSVVAETFAVDYAEIRLPIPESRLRQLNLPPMIAGASGSGTRVSPVELVSGSGDGTTFWNADLVRTEGVLDSRTRVLFAVAQVTDPYGIYSENPREPLRIGTYVNATIQGRELRDVYVLPRHTLQTADLIWVADRENRLRRRQVDVIAENGDNAYIRSGLEPGDRVVITRLENPLNGTLVETARLETAPAVVN